MPFRGLMIIFRSSALYSPIRMGYLPSCTELLKVFTVFHGLRPRWLDTCGSFPRHFEQVSKKWLFLDTSIAIGIEVLTFSRFEGGSSHF
jgi:hypothetical protein